MRRIDAMKVLQLDTMSFKTLTQKKIDSAYRKQCKKIHPDNRQRRTCNNVGKRMDELSDARTYLISQLDIADSNIDVNQLWNEERGEWISLGERIVMSGCLWDDTKDFPMEELFRMVIQLSLIHI